MLSALGLHTASTVPSIMQDASSQLLEQVTPLEESIIASTLQFLIPPSAHGIPPSILSRQLLQRQHFLLITPEEPASYFFLNPDHPSQDTSKVLSTLNELADQNMEDLAHSVLYSTDGEDVQSHVITAAPGAIQFVFIWEKPDDDSDKAGWKYLDVKPFSPSSNLYPSLEEAEEARLRMESTESLLAREASITDDSYWSAYDNVAPAASNGRAQFMNGVASIVRNQSATGLSARSASPRREEAYWDRYGYGSDDEEEGGDVPPSTVAPPPPAQARASAIREELRFLGLPASRQMQQTQVWTAGSSRFSPEDLSEALAMHLQPDLAPSSEVAQGLAINLNSPPSKGLLLRTVDEPVSPPEADHASSLSDPSVGQETSSAAGDNVVSINETAVLDAIRGIYTLWRSTRTSQSGNSLEEKQAFLALVTGSLADL